MDPPAVRIGWLTMLLSVLTSTGGRELYEDLIADVKAEIRAAQAELEAAAEEGDRVRERA